ncbi:MAG TPA: cytochrome c biogenesis protein CcdA [Fimbriimonadaceae bacterium]|nr:cytochrome c biogenesis protein CcdA [Fimbriimonadaceae bacterium]
MKKLLTFLLILIMAACASAQDTPPKVEIKLGKATAKPGATLKATVKITFSPGLHGYANPPSEEGLIPVKVTSGTKETTLTKVEYPAGIEMRVAGAEKPVRVYEGVTEIPVTFKLPAKGKEAVLKIVVEYQQCTDENCFRPNSVAASAKVKLDPKAATDGPEDEPSDSAAVTQTPEGPDTPVSSDSEPSVTLTKNEPTPAGTEPANAESAKPDKGFVANILEDGFKNGNYVLILLACLLTGLALTLTPCVYPVIPITISFFSGQTSGSRAGRVGLGLMYMLGIAIMYGAVGGVAAALGGAVGDLFKKPWFLFALAGMMVALALSMFDVYQIGIPGPIARQIKGRAGAVGALIMGLLVGVAAAPCAGALVSSLAIEVARIGVVPLGILVFTMVGVGIGLPFVAIGALSTGAKALPKSGGWLKAVKAVLGMVVLYIAVDYLFQGLGWKADEPRTQIGWVVFYAAAAAYLFLFEKTEPNRLIVGIKGAAILGLGLFAGQSWSTYKQVVQERELLALSQKSGGEGVPTAIPTKIAWQKFTPEAFEAAKQTGKPILIDGTADWCKVCKEIDEAVFKKPAAIVAMRDVIALKIDLSTGVDPAYDEAVRKQFNIVGLPHIMLFDGSGKEVAKFMDIDELPNPEVLIDNLKKAGAAL